MGEKTQKRKRKEKENRSMEKRQQKIETNMI